MLFDKFFEFLALYLVLVLFIALLGMKFAKKHKELNAQNGENSKFDANSKLGAPTSANVAHSTKRKKSALSGLYEHCPCRKAVENGVMSSICIYSGVAGFMLSLTNIALVGIYSVANFAVLGLSVICAYFGWVLKK